MVFSLALPDSAQADLQKMVAEGKVVSPTQLNKNYSADAADAKALTSWLKSEGFKIEKIPADRTSIYAEGTVEQIQKSLHVKMVRVTKDGITYTAAQDAPSLPASVGKSVSAIVGLQPFRRAHKQFRICVPQSGVTARPAPGEARSSQTCGGRPEQEPAPTTAAVRNGYLVSRNSEGLRRRRSFRDRQGPDHRHPDRYVSGRCRSEGVLEAEQAGDQDRTGRDDQRQ